MSIHKLLSSALNEAGTFKHGTVPDIRKAVAEAKAAIGTLQPGVEAIRTRRNETIAHLDARPLSDPAGYLKAGLISSRQIDRLFSQTGAILNKFSLLYRGASVPLDLKDARDYERVIDSLAAST